MNELKYFISVDSASYVNGMFIAFNEQDEAKYKTQELIELSQSVFESVGPDSIYADGAVKQGAPRITQLDATQASAIQASLTDAAMQSISVLQLKLLAGRTLTDSEKNKLNTTLDYIDAVAAIDVNSAPDIIWPLCDDVG
ncbi:tail fiber assembly protein [Klebsiella pneumoniae]|uniref:tail fiber assembly protein n=1 Tax=Klebsiella pneumoniae TaxID=573 RepID=UPI0034E4F764